MSDYERTLAMACKVIAKRPQPSFGHGRALPQQPTCIRVNSLFEPSFGQTRSQFAVSLRRSSARYTRAAGCRRLVPTSLRVFRRTRF